MVVEIVLEMTDETMVTAKPMPRRPVTRCTNARGNLHPVMANVTSNQQSTKVSKNVSVQTQMVPANN